LIAGVIALGLVTAFNGVLVNYWDYSYWVRAEYAQGAQASLAGGVPGYYALLRWHPRFSPLLKCWTFHGRPYFLVLEALKKPGLILGLFGGFLVVLLVGLVVLSRAMSSREEGSKAAGSTAPLG